MIDIFTYLFIQWRLKFFIRIRNLIFVSSYHSIFKNQALTTKKHKAIIYTQSSLSNKKVNLTRYQLYINWMKIYISMVRKIWLVPCMCFNDVYVKISYHFIFEHWRIFCISSESMFEFVVGIVLFQIHIL